MNVNDHYELVKYIIAKNQDGYLSPDEYNRTANQASNSLLSFYIGEVVQYQYGRPVSRIEIGNSEQLLQKLAPFIPPPYQLTTDPTGYVLYPDDYLATIAINTNTGMQRVRFSQQDSLYSYVNSVIDPIASNPVYTLEDAGFRFYPASIGAAKLSYVSQPKTIIWNYTLDPVTQLPVYNPVGSVDPEWSNIDIMDMTARQLAMCGVNLQAGQVAAFATQIKTQGQ